MRLEDWQKWLETQFIEPAAGPSTAVAEAEEAPATPSTPEQIADAVVSHVPAPAPTIARAAQPVVSTPPPPQQHSPTGLVDDVEIPSIERYLPFLRPAAPVAQPPAEEPQQPKTPEPAVETAATAAPEPAEESAATSAAEPAPSDPIAPTPTLSAPLAVAPEAPPAARPQEPAPSEHQAEQRPARRPAAVHHRTRPAALPDANEIAADLANGGLWDLVPRHIHTLVALGTDEVAKNSYKREFRESRIELIGRLLDPTLSLEETARLLNVCPTTVRRYTNRGLLTHQRTAGDQRRFKLSDVLAFLESQSRTTA